MSPGAGTRRLAWAAAVVVGMLTAVQSRINGELSHVLDHPVEAAVVSFGSGLVIVTVLVLASPRIRDGLRRMAAALREGRLPRWMVLGGLLGGTFVAIQAAAVPTVGVAVFTVAVVAGQSVNSIVVDRIGLGPAGRQSVTGRRIASAAIAIVAVAFAVSDRLGSASFAPVAVMAAFAAGVLVAIQQAINGRASVAAGNALSATWVNFVGGTALLSLLLGTLAIGGRAPSGLPSSPWWIYAGGAIGVVFIATAAWVVPRVGVLMFALLSIAGQLTGALVLDLVVPTPGTSTGWHLVGGVALAFTAVAISAASRSTRHPAPRSVDAPRA